MDHLNLLIITGGNRIGLRHPIRLYKFGPWHVPLPFPLMKIYGEARTRYTAYDTIPSKPISSHIVPWIEELVCTIRAPINPWQRPYCACDPTIYDGIPWNPWNSSWPTKITTHTHSTCADSIDPPSFSKDMHPPYCPWHGHPLAKNS